jgi:hypothetical protein
MSPAAEVFGSSSRKGLPEVGNTVIFKGLGQTLKKTNKKNKIQNLMKLPP